MRWSYPFSYGASNEIDFSKYELLQLVGRNGHGKSSIALILEEVLYNKNSKGIKKGNILNRYTKAKTYTIELEFTKDSDSYEIKTSRGSTQTVKLLKNGVDISEHTATATYKLIEEIIGYDHKTFTQIIYQSSAFSLEFLTATDTNRKKFLIELLRLTKYSDALEHYKELTKTLTKEYEVLLTKHKLASAILGKYSAADLVIKELHTVAEVDASISPQIDELTASLSTITRTNAAIIQNNTYKRILDSLIIPNIPPKPGDVTPLKISESELTKKIAALKITATGTVKDNCSSCGAPIDNSQKKKLIEEAKLALEEAATSLRSIKSAIAEFDAEAVAYNTAVNAQSEWEKYYGLYDKALPTETLDKVSIEQKLASLKATKLQQEAAKKKDEALNLEIASHNARVEVIKAQLAAAQEESTVIAMEMAEVSSRLANTQILVKTFSTSGLVAYKIECLIKDLEELTNTYLQDMSDGRFQLAFKMSASDKLDVVITDNGNDIDIAALSNGELARVNVSTLLAIRKLMQSLSDTRSNLLILDETVESLDVDGKEKLVEVLLKEEYLNTVLVSHGFTHPLLEKISIIKENNVSRIE